MADAWAFCLPQPPWRADVLEEVGLGSARPVHLFLEAYEGPDLPQLTRGNGGALLSAPLPDLERLLVQLPEPWRRQAEDALRPAPAALRLPRGLLPLGSRTYVMGIVNVTPDSFSDGGRFSGVDEACRHALQLQEAGADIIDIGGESTRHFQRVHRRADAQRGVAGGALPLEEELRRVVPVLEALRGQIAVPISIDTYKWPVAEAALRRGAEIVNDVTAGLGDPEMLPGAARRGAAVVLMHAKEDAGYRRVGDEIRRHLRDRARAAEAAGVARDAIVLDPGFGFGKEPEHSFASLRMLPSLRALGYPVLSGPSRKSFLGAATGKGVGERGDATVAAVALSVALGADIVRVHDVGPAVDAVRVADRTVRL
jgi:dihydropteroate synthase